VSGRHTRATTLRRRSAALLAAATVLGLWFGLRAPDVSPVAGPAPAVQAPAEQVPAGREPAGEAVVPPVQPQPGGRGPQRGGGR
jgi:hypothetical protein